MKKTLLFALAVVAMVACKKTPYQPEEGNEIKIASSTMSTKALLPDYEGNENNFYQESDQIGIFLENKETTDGTFTTANGERVNAGYSFAKPFWTRLPDNVLNNVTGTAERLMYPTITPMVAKLYAYFPYSKTGSAGYAITVTAGAEGAAPEIAFNFKDRADKQAEVDTLRKLDIMWGKNDNENKISSAPINIQFEHKMTQLQFQFKLSESAQTTPAVVERYIKAIEVRGKNIIVDNAKLNINTGALVAGNGTDPAATGSVWVKYFTAGTAEKPTPKLSSKADGAAPDDYQALHQMLIFPFTASQVAGANEFVIYLAKTDAVFANVAALQAAVETGDVDRRVIAVQPENYEATGKWIFAANNANKFSVAIDLSKTAVNVTTEIAAWNSIVDHEVPAE